MKAKCECNHEYQDKVYGKGVRLFNKMKKPDSFRCTVCAKVSGNGGQSSGSVKK